MPTDLKYSPVEDALEALAQGRVVIVVDDEARENEGDFIAAAEKLTPETVEFMITHGRGQLCMPIMPELAARLRALVRRAHGAVGGELQVQPHDRRAGHAQLADHQLDGRCVRAAHFAAVGHA